MFGSSQRGIVITDGPGLHLRAARRLVDLARQFQSEVLVFCNDRAANGKSILDLLLLSAEHGALLQIEVSGPDAEEAAAAISDLVENNFNEPREVGLAC